MSKAILVIDMPSNCKECQFRVAKHYNLYEYDFWCEVNNEMFKGLKKDFTPKNFKCPLKPMPEKKHNNGGYRVIDGTEWFYDSEHDDGWNDCLDEILGEEE